MNSQTQFHGDIDLHRLTVYHTVDDFMRHAGKDWFDLSTNTFAPAETFCWNCEQTGEGNDEYTVYNCLGHPVGADISDRDKIV